MWRLQPTVGERDLWHLDLPGVLGEAPWAWGSPQVSVQGWGGVGPHVGRPLSPPGSESGGDIGDEASPLLCSFVRSVTMDKWKDVELEKMKAGGNARFREFLESQEDYDPCWSLQEKYNSRAAALFRDRVRQAARHVEAAPATGTEVPCGSDHSMEAACHLRGDSMHGLGSSHLEDLGGLWFTGLRMGFPPRFREALCPDTSVHAAKAPLRTSVPAGKAHRSGCRKRASETKSLPVWRPHPAEPPARGVKPEGLCGGQGVHCGQEHLGHLDGPLLSDPGSLGRWLLWPKAKNGLWSHHPPRAGLRLNPGHCCPLPTGSSSSSLLASSVLGSAQPLPPPSSVVRFWSEGLQTVAQCLLWPWSPWFPCGPPAGSGRHGAPVAPVPPEPRLPYFSPVSAAEPKLELPSAQSLVFRGARHEQVGVTAPPRDPCGHVPTLCWPLTFDPPLQSLWPGAELLRLWGQGF